MPFPEQPSFEGVRPLEFMAVGRGTSREQESKLNLKPGARICLRGHPRRESARGGIPAASLPARASGLYNMFCTKYYLRLHLG